MERIFNSLQVERPVGTAGNSQIIKLLEHWFKELGFEVKSIGFDCTVWEYAASSIKIGDHVLSLCPSPYSAGIQGSGSILICSTLDELKKADVKGKILFLTWELAKTPLQPKDYPFYFPEEDKELIQLLEEKQPLAIVAVNVRHPLCGLNPFPLFEDGNFLIPSAYVDQAALENVIRWKSEKKAEIIIHSKKRPSKSRQIIARSQGTSGAKKVLCCAHMDSKYNTPGALDNAAGVLLLIETAKHLVGKDYTVEIVPFNGEEYYAASGEVAYLEYIKERNELPGLVINIDSPCHIGAINAISFYNFDDSKERADKIIDSTDVITEGPQWYAGDHVPFVFMGIPCMTVSCSDLLKGGLDKTHTPLDIKDNVDLSLVKPTAKVIAQLADTYAK